MRRKGFTLHQIGLEKVVDVDGDSGASVGDRAGYKEYQLPCEGGASVFFEENWFKGKNVCRRLSSTVGEY